MRPYIINLLTLVIALTILGQVAVPPCLSIDDVPPCEIPLEEGDDDNKKEYGKDKIFQSAFAGYTSPPNQSVHQKTDLLFYSDILLDVIAPPPKG